jgi:hypothetical protein
MRLLDSFNYLIIDSRGAMTLLTLMEPYSGMDQGSDFECEFRARRIRVRGNFAHKSFSEIIHL